MLLLYFELNEQYIWVTLPHVFRKKKTWAGQLNNGVTVKQDIKGTKN